MPILQTIKSFVSIQAQAIGKLDNFERKFVVQANTTLSV
jgi:hypothetical protein